MSVQIETRHTILGAVMVGLISLALLVAGLLFWALNFQIAGAVVVQGRIEVEQNSQVVQHATGGVVSAVYVQNGTEVLEGDPLLQLEVVSMQFAAQQIEAQLFELRVKIAYARTAAEELEQPQLDADLQAFAVQDKAASSVLSAHRTHWQARQDARVAARLALDKRKLQIAAQISALDAREAAFLAELELLSFDIGDRQILFEKGLASAASMRALRREKARMTGALAETDARRTGAREELAELMGISDREVAETISEAYRTLDALRQKEKALDAELAALRRSIAEQTVRAPVSGVVHKLRVQTPRAVVQRAEVLMYLVPQNRPLLIAAQVPPIHIGEVYIGQNVGVSLSPSGLGDARLLDGVIRYISADAVASGHSGLPLFRVEIALAPEQLHEGQRDPELRLGMPVTAFLKRQERTVMTYLLDPLISYFGRAFRES